MNARAGKYALPVGTEPLALWQGGGRRFALKEEWGAHIGRCRFPERTFPFEVDPRAMHSLPRGTTKGGTTLEAPLERSEGDEPQAGASSEFPAWAPESARLAKLLNDDHEVRRYIALEKARVELTPSRAGRWFHPSKSERTLVLFTLAIVVTILAIGAIVLQATNRGTNETFTAVVGLTGTGLGFIGGMVSRPPPEQPSPK
jgi:hypothetical protein